MIFIKSAFQIGIYTALGYVVVVAMTLPLSFMADYMINSGRFRVGTVRKLMNSLGYFGCATGLVWLSFVGCNTTQAVIALCISVGFYAGGMVGYNVR